MLFAALTRLDPELRDFTMLLLRLGPLRLRVKKGLAQGHCESVMERGPDPWCARLQGLGQPCGDHMDYFCDTLWPTSLTLAEAQYGEGGVAQAKCLQEGS